MQTFASAAFVDGEFIQLMVVVLIREHSWFRSFPSREAHTCLKQRIQDVASLPSGDEGNFEEILTKLGIAQSMLMLPVCIHSTAANAI